MDLEQEIKKTTTRLIVAAALMGTVLCATVWALVTYVESLLVLLGVVAVLVIIENRVVALLVRRLNELKAMQGQEGDVQETQP